MNDKDRQKQLERRVAAEIRLPSLHPNDSRSIDFRKVIIEREGLGVESVAPKHLKAIKTEGYDAFYVGRMNSYSKIGLRTFHKLAAMGRVELTTEHIIFHHFRERLKRDCRRRIAILLLSKSAVS